MDSFKLQPQYTTREIPGRCLKCLTEHELNNCLALLLGSDSEDEATKHKYAALVAFLEAPEFEEMRQESEKLLAEGRQVSVRIEFENGQPKYELVID
jgi:hypothetical protein